MNKPIELGDFLTWCKSDDIVLIQCYHEDDVDGTLFEDMYKGTVDSMVEVELDMIVDIVENKEEYIRIVVYY